MTDKIIDSPAKIPNIKGAPQSAAEGDVSFLLKLSHELKTHIHGISGISEYLTNNWEELNDQIRLKSLGAISSSSNSLVQLIDSLINTTHTRGQINFNFQKTDLIKTTKDIVQTCQNLYVSKNEIEIKFQTEIEECFSIADSFWYGQILTNLISNAVNYSKKGEITVTFSINIINNIDYCVISVQDEGIGIPEKELDTIFQPFNRGSGENMYFKGTGLGLAICQEIIEAHNGTISASNNESVGATIKMSIPIKI